MTKTQQLTRSAIVIALYVVICYAMQGVSFGAIQVRMANALYGLCWLYPFLVVPLMIAVGMANLIGGYGLVDVIAGSLSSGIVCFVISKLPQKTLIIPVIILGISTLIGSYLHFLIGLPFITIWWYLVLGQIIPAVTSYFLVKRLE